MAKIVTFSLVLRVTKAMTRSKLLIQQQCEKADAIHREGSKRSQCDKYSKLDFSEEAFL